MFILQTFKRKINFSLFRNIQDVNFLSYSELLNLLPNLDPPANAAISSTRSLFSSSSLIFLMSVLYPFSFSSESSIYLSYSNASIIEASSRSRKLKPFKGFVWRVILTMSCFRMLMSGIYLVVSASIS